MTYWSNESEITDYSKTVDTVRLALHQAADMLGRWDYRKQRDVYEGDERLFRFTPSAQQSELVAAIAAFDSGDMTCEQAVNLIRRDDLWSYLNEAGEWRRDVPGGGFMQELRQVMFYSEPERNSARSLTLICAPWPDEQTDEVFDAFFRFMSELKLLVDDGRTPFDIDLVAGTFGDPLNGDTIEGLGRLEYEREATAE